MPLISVIVPMYNVESYVGACIASLRAQTFSDFEVVCVDDGSTDATAPVAREAAGADERFRFVARENGGLSAARNTGLKAAQGKYVCFLDSDDEYAACALEMLARIVEAQDVELVDFSACTVYDNERVRLIHEEDYGIRSNIEGVFTGQELFVRYWQLGQYVSSACFHLISREVLERANLSFGEGLLHEDELFTPFVYANARTAVFLNEPLYVRRMREDSIMTRRPTMANVRSLYLIGQLLHASLLEHADAWDDAFVEALCRDVCMIRCFANSYYGQVDEAARVDYLAQLSAQERIDFELSVAHVCDLALERAEAIEASRAYQLGNALVAAPRFMRDHVLTKFRK